MLFIGKDFKSNELLEILIMNKGKVQVTNIRKYKVENTTYL